MKETMYYLNKMNTDENECSFDRILIGIKFN